MKRAIGVLVLLLSLMWVPVAHAQTTNPPATNTPTPTPTPSPTPSPTPTPTVTPSATDIVNAATAAIEAKRTVRIAEMMKAHGSGVSISLASHGVVSYKPVAERLHMTEHDTIRKGGTTKSATQRSEIVVVKKGIAMRTGHQKWTCQSLAASAGSGGMTVGTITSGSNGFTVEFANPATTTINGIPVWDILITLNAAAPGSGAVKAVEHAYISQVDDTIVRETATVKEKIVFQIGNSKKTMTLHVHGKDTINYSDYGLPVHIKLPTACGG